VVVSLYVGADGAPTTAHPLGLRATWLAPGDQTAATKLRDGTMLRSYLWLAGLDVQATPEAAAIVAFGDSITEDTHGAVHQTVAGDLPWSVVLARRLVAAERQGGPRLGVVNVGIAGNRLLAPETGPAGIDRFGRDALKRTGVSQVLLMEGVNDLGLGSVLVNSGSSGSLEDLPTAEELEAAYRLLGRQATRAGVALFISPITPAGDELKPSWAAWTPQQVALRRSVNAWVQRSSWYEPSFDFARILADPHDEDWLLQDADSGDGLHPNAYGHQLVGSEIDLDSLASRGCAQ